MGRLAAVENREREGDTVIAVVPASTLDHVVFFADDGTAYTMRVNWCRPPPVTVSPSPNSSSWAIGSKSSVSPLPMNGSSPRKSAASKDDPAGPYILGSRQGADFTHAVRPFPYGVEKGRPSLHQAQRGRQGRNRDSAGDEKSIYFASRDGHILHFLVTRSTSSPASARGSSASSLKKTIYLGPPDNPEHGHAGGGNFRGQDA